MNDHHRMSSRRSPVPGFAVAFGVLIGGLLAAFTVGRYPVGLGDLVGVLASKVLGHRTDVSPAIESVILQVRGPRVLALYWSGLRSRLPAPHFKACSVTRWYRPIFSARPRVRLLVRWSAFIFPSASWLFNP